MATDPAFLFYYQDFAFGTRKLERRFKGAYIDLIIEQADKYAKNDKDYKLSLDDIKEVLSGDFDVWELLKEKYEEKNGLFWNKKILDVQNKRKNFCNSRKTNRMNKSHMKNTCNTHVKHVEDVNENENKDEYKNERKEQTEAINEIVEHMNTILSSNYKPTTPKTRDLIKARLNEGFTVEDFKIVIHKKFAEWCKSAEFSKYLRPQTLFSGNFEGYLNQMEVQEKLF